MKVLTPRYYLLTLGTEYQLQDGKVSLSMHPDEDLLDWLILQYVISLLSDGLMLVVVLILYGNMVLIPSRHIWNRYL